MTTTRLDTTLERTEGVALDARAEGRPLAEALARAQPLPGAGPGRATGPCPVIRREGITWTGGVDGRPLSLAFAFENPHEVWTALQTAAVRVADFGAFLPWRPLPSVQVEPIPPGGRRVVKTGGDLADRVDGVEARESRRLDDVVRRAALRDLARQEVRTRAEDPAGRRLAGLLRRVLGQDLQDARDPFSFPQLRPAHFMGNFDLRVGHAQPLERHCGSLDGLRAGVRNVVNFKVGDRKQDTYRFRVAACEPGWRLDLRGIDMESPARLCGPEGRTGALDEGCELQITWALLWVTVTPPAHAESGVLALEVHRASIDASTTVEFELGVRRPDRRVFAS